MMALITLEIHQESQFKYLQCKIVKKYFIQLSKALLIQCCMRTECILIDSLLILNFAGRSSRVLVRTTQFFKRGRCEYVEKLQPTQSKLLDIRFGLV